MPKIKIRNRALLGTEGFQLNYHLNRGSAVILPLHTKACIRKPCSCGADVVNCSIVWSDWRADGRAKIPHTVAIALAEYGIQLEEETEAGLNRALHPLSIDQRIDITTQLLKAGILKS